MHSIGDYDLQYIAGISAPSSAVDRIQGTYNSPTHGPQPRLYNAVITDTANFTADVAALTKSPYQGIFNIIQYLPTGHVAELWSWEIDTTLVLTTSPVQYLGTFIIPNWFVDTTLLRYGQITLTLVDDNTDLGTIQKEDGMTIFNSDRQQIGVWDAAHNYWVWIGQTAGASFPTGGILEFTWTAITPAGYKKCDGTEIGRTTPLGTVIGDHYGPGDGSTTYNLPYQVDRIIKD